MDSNNRADEVRKTHCGCERCQRSTDEAREDREAREAKERSLADGAATPANTDALAKEIGEFESKTAVTVVRKGEKFEYSISYDGKDKVLATTDATTKGLEEAEKKMTDLVLEKMKELEKTFNVKFSKEGDDVVKQWVEKADCSWERGVMVKARNPNMIEIYGIQAALYRCQPSDIAVNKNGVKFHFLETNYYKDQPVLAYFTSADKDGNPSVFFEPGANKKKPATERDSARFGRDHLFSVEALTTHELSHNHQAKTGWYTPAEKEKLAKSIGWMPVVDKDGATDFIMKGKSGEYYRYGKDHCKDSKVWVKCDSNGDPLDEKGAKAGSYKAAKHLKRTDVSESALVKPLTYYFPSPLEMYAEGLMLYRLGGKDREQLLKESPALHEAAKKGDQVEIDARYGSNESGAARYIRGADGLLKDNTEAERKAVKEYEEKILNESKDKQQKSKDGVGKSKSPESLMSFLPWHGLNENLLGQRINAAARAMRSDFVPDLLLV